MLGCRGFEAWRISGEDYMSLVEGMLSGAA